MSNRLSLAPEARSVSQARRWVAAQLVGSAADIAELLVSELVTNAVLHTGTPVEVALDCTPAGIRVEVADFSPALPSAKHYAADAGTGRGLVLLEALASSWGTVSSPTGKLVWFTLAAPDAVEEVAAPSMPLDQPTLTPCDSPSPNGGPDFPHLVLVQLRRIPGGILRRASEQYDGLFREFRLVVERDPSERHAIAGRLIELADELSARFSGFTGAPDSQLQAALAEGAETIDLDYQVPPEAGAASGLYDQLLDEADAYCRAGQELLTVAPSPESVALRKWLLGEFVHQAAGDQPVAWPDSAWAQVLPLDDGDPGRDHVRSATQP